MLKWLYTPKSGCSSWHFKLPLESLLFYFAFVWHRFFPFSIKAERFIDGEQVGCR